MQDKNNQIDQLVIIETVKDLGDFVKSVRTSQKLTQSDISGLANTGNRFLIELEKGKETVQLNKVLDVLGVLGLELRVSRKHCF